MTLIVPFLAKSCHSKRMKKFVDKSTAISRQKALVDKHVYKTV